MDIVCLVVSPSILRVIISSLSIPFHSAAIPYFPLSSFNFQNSIVFIICSTIGQFSDVLFSLSHCFVVLSIISFISILFCCSVSEFQYICFNSCYSLFSCSSVIRLSQFSIVKFPAKYSSTFYLVKCISSQFAYLRCLSPIISTSCIAVGFILLNIFCYYYVVLLGRLLSSSMFYLVLHTTDRIEYSICLLKLFQLLCFAMYVQDSQHHVVIMLSFSCLRLFR